MNQWTLGDLPGRKESDPAQTVRRRLLKRSSVPESLFRTS
jgi:hypothetical protein